MAALLSRIAPKRVCIFEGRSNASAHRTSSRFRFVSIFTGISTGSPHVRHYVNCSANSCLGRLKELISFSTEGCDRIRMQGRSIQT